MIYKPDGLDDIHIASDVMIYTLKRDGRPLDNGHGGAVMICKGRAFNDIHA